MNRWSLSAPFADEPKLLGITMLDEAVAQTARLAVQAVPRWEWAGGGRNSTRKLLWFEIAKMLIAV